MEKLIIDNAGVICVVLFVVFFIKETFSKKAKERFKNDWDKFNKKS